MRYPVLRTLVPKATITMWRAVRTRLPYYLLFLITVPTTEFFLHHEGTSHMKDRVTYQSLTHSLTIRLFRTMPQPAGNPGSIGLAAFQGISVEEAVAQRVGPSLSSDDRHPPDGAKIDKQEVPKKFERQTPLKQQDPALRFSRAKSESAAHGEWGAGEAGYKPPTTPGERMRK